jgi:ornithine carbamoyltransferase
MAVTHEAGALYMHCLPADITGISCAEGEVEASVFDRYRVPMYLEASYKPYIIAAMILLSKAKTPADNLTQLLSTGAQRIRD